MALVAQIQSEPPGSLDLATLAERIGLSPTHLQRVFSNSVGESPKRIATRIALERAAARLLTTSDAVLDVALDAGFESHEGFIRAFRRHFGVTPRRYRAGAKVRTDACSTAAELHRETVERVAPCVGFYGVRFGSTDEGETK